MTIGNVVSPERRFHENNGRSFSCSFRCEMKLRTAAGRFSREGLTAKIPIGGSTVQSGKSSTRGPAFKSCATCQSASIASLCPSIAICRITSSIVAVKLPHTRTMCCCASLANKRYRENGGTVTRLIGPHKNFEGVMSCERHSAHSSADRGNQ